MIYDAKKFEDRIREYTELGILDAKQISALEEFLDFKRKKHDALIKDIDKISEFHQNFRYLLTEKEDRFLELDKEIKDKEAESNDLSDTIERQKIELAHNDEKYRELHAHLIILEKRIAEMEEIRDSLVSIETRATIAQQKAAKANEEMKDFDTKLAEIKEREAKALASEKYIMENTKIFMKKPVEILVDWHPNVGHYVRLVQDMPEEGGKFDIIRQTY